MAANAINNFFHGAQSPGFGLGSLGLGMTSSTKAPQLERYHEEHHGWTKSKGKKSNVALSALTLLAFLFFLHILQNCIQEHMQEMKGKGEKAQQSYINGQMPSIIIVDDGGGTNARDNLKGDDGEFSAGISEELNTWPLQGNEQKTDVQNRFIEKPKPNERRPKKKNNRQRQEQEKWHKNKNTKERNGMNNWKRHEDENFALNVDTHNTRMHRIDDTP